MLNPQHLNTIINRVVNEHPGVADDYRNGNQDALNYLVNKVVTEANGEANPNVVQKVLADSL